MRTSPGKLLTLILVLGVLLGDAGLVTASPPIGSIKAVSGEVLLSPDQGKPFVPAQPGAPLQRGGTVIALEEGSATLILEGRGELQVADNASLKLSEVAGEFTAVTGVRAPVLFLYPSGGSTVPVGQTLAVTFGLNHQLDQVRGVTQFELYALHEDAEDEAESDDPQVLIEFSQRLAGFQAKPASDESSEYTWYQISAETPLEIEGEYTLYVVARREDELVRLGQPALLMVEGDLQ